MKLADLVRYKSVSDSSCHPIHILKFLFVQIERDAGKQSGLLFVLV
jgi:hypothetical protein